MSVIDFDSILGDEQLKFLEENYNINDIHKLSGEEYLDLYDKLCTIEIHEVSKAIDEAVTGKPEVVSRLGVLVSDIVTFMGNQFIEGGRRYNNLIG